MILQALVNYYEDLCRHDKLSAPGWSSQKISFVLCIDDSGSIIDCVSLKQAKPENGKTLPKVLDGLPAGVKRSSGIVPDFLWGNSAYILGVDNKSEKAGESEEKKKKSIERAIECYKVNAAYHLQLLESVNTPAAQALKQYFRKWDPKQIKSCAVLTPYYEELLDNANLIFRYKGKYIHEDPAVRDVWQKHYQNNGSKQMMTCLVTGQQEPIATVHPSIKGIRGGQPSGCTLVGYNAQSFCSFEKEQGLNAPVGQYAAFAYAEALNYLISSTKTNYIGNTLVLCWAEGGKQEYSDSFNDIFFDESDSVNEADLRSMLDSLTHGIPVEYKSTMLDPGTNFYILGISPNSSRISVRFFIRNSFGKILQNVKNHYDRMAIILPKGRSDSPIYLWRLLYETVNSKSRDKSASPVLAGELTRAVLNDSFYPSTLLNAVNLRIRAEHNITPIKAAIIKAYYLKNRNNDVPEEVLTVSLNQDCKNVPYNLGRLFSVLEAIQDAANPGINTTIKDKYFNSASATPAVIFPMLINLSQKHLRKMNVGKRIYYEKQVQEIMAGFDDALPTHLNLPQQGAFQLGYYHQTQARYQSTKDKEN